MCRLGAVSSASTVFRSLSLEGDARVAKKTWECQESGVTDKGAIYMKQGQYDSYNRRNEQKQASSDRRNTGVGQHQVI